MVLFSKEASEQFSVDLEKVKNAVLNFESLSEDDKALLRHYDYDRLFTEEPSKSLLLDIKYNHSVSQKRYSFTFTLYEVFLVKILVPVAFRTNLGYFDPVKVRTISYYYNFVALLASNATKAMRLYPPKIRSEFSQLCARVFNDSLPQFYKEFVDSREASSREELNSILEPALRSYRKRVENEIVQLFMIGRYSEAFVKLCTYVSVNATLYLRLDKIDAVSNIERSASLGAKLIRDEHRYAVKSILNTIPQNSRLNIAARNSMLSKFANVWKILGVQTVEDL